MYSICKTTLTKERNNKDRFRQRPFWWLWSVGWCCLPWCCSDTRRWRHFCFCLAAVAPLSGWSGSPARTTLNDISTQIDWSNSQCWSQNWKSTFYFAFALLPASRSPSARNDCCNVSCSQPPSPARPPIKESSADPEKEKLPSSMFPPLQISCSG